MGFGKGVHDREVCGWISMACVKWRFEPGLKPPALQVVVYYVTKQLCLIEN